MLCEPTATLWTGDPPAAESSGDRGVMMPKCRHTRAHDTTKATAAERRLNDSLVAERNKPPEQWADRIDDAVGWLMVVRDGLRGITPNERAAASVRRCAASRV